MGDVIPLPGVERRDLTGPVLRSDEILQQAIEEGVEDVVVVGRARDGSIFVSGATNDADRVVGILMGGVQWMSQNQFQQGIYEEPKEPA
jgi:transcriptional/translational regulatory protein YebC/TACO1